MTAAPPKTDPFAVYEELNRTFRFYIALTVFANIVYGVLVAAFGVLILFADAPYRAAFLLIPAMVSTGVGTMSYFGIGEAVSLHRAIQETGTALGLPHVTRSLMLPVQTVLTLIFHVLFAFGAYAVMFFTAIGLL